MKKFSRYIAEKVNEKQIMKDLDSGMSADAVIGKYANKKTTNTDEIRKVIKQHAWNKRMKKEETELNEDFGFGVSLLLSVAAGGMAGASISRSSHRDVYARSTIEKIKDMLTLKDMRRLKTLKELIKKDDQLSDIVKTGMSPRGFKPNKAKAFTDRLKELLPDEQFRELVLLTDKVSQRVRKGKEFDVKEETELSEVSAKMARRAAAASQAKAYTAGSGYQNPEQEKDADRLDRKSQKAMAHVKKRQGEKGVKRVNRLTGKMLGMEEVEQIDEISPELAMRYHDKAGRDMRKHADNASFARDSLMKDKKNKNLHYTTKKERGDMARKSERKLRNRAIGMSRAGSRMEEIDQIDEKSVSQAQQKLMGMALAYKRGEMNDASDEVKKLASSMSEKDLEDFAKTKHKGLPKKVDEKLDPVGQSDSDIDNDGDVDSSDKYLHKRRKAIAKAIAKKTK